MRFLKILKSPYPLCAIRINHRTMTIRAITFSTFISIGKQRTEKNE